MGLCDKERFFGGKKSNHRFCLFLVPVTELRLVLCFKFL